MLLSGNVLTIDKDGIPSNADRASELSKFIARHIANSLMAEVHEKIQGQTSGAKFEQINMAFLTNTIKNCSNISYFEPSLYYNCGFFITMGALVFLRQYFLVMHGLTIGTFD